MTPHQGAGAGQAIEDAYIIAGLLAHQSTTLANVDRALQAYEHVRIPVSQHVVDGSRLSGMMYQLQHPDYKDKYPELGPAIDRQWEWVKSPNPDEELNRAVRWCYDGERIGAKL